MEKSANAHIDNLLWRHLKTASLLPNAARRNQELPYRRRWHYLCDIPNEEPERMATDKLYPDALDTLNKWYEEGHVITFFTSRTEDHREVTERWLQDNGSSGTSAHGQPRGGNYHWVDNHIVRATGYTGEFTNLVDKRLPFKFLKNNSYYSHHDYFQRTYT